MQVLAGHRSGPLVCSGCKSNIVVVGPRPVRWATAVASSAGAAASSSSADVPSTPLTPGSPLNRFEVFRQQLSKSKSMAVVLPFASLGIAGGSMTEVYGALSKALDIYLVLLTVRVLLTWFRNISWTSEPFNTIRQFTDPYLNIFRGIVPAIGGIDLSPMLGFFLLSFAAKQLRRLSFGM